MPRSTKDLTGPAKISGAGQKDQLMRCQPSRSHLRPRSHLRRGRFANASSKLNAAVDVSVAVTRKRFFSGLNTNESSVASWRVRTLNDNFRSAALMTLG